MVLVRQVVGQRFVVNLLVLQASVAEDLLRLVPPRGIVGGIASEALEELLRAVEGFGRRGGGPGRVDDVALRVEVVEGFAGGALEVWDAGALAMGGAGAAEVAFDPAEEEVHLHGLGGGVGGVASGGGGGLMKLCVEERKLVVYVK